MPCPTVIDKDLRGRKPRCPGVRRNSSPRASTSIDLQRRLIASAPVGSRRWRYGEGHLCVDSDLGICVDSIPFLVIDLEQNVHSSDFTLPSTNIYNISSMISEHKQVQISQK